MTVPGPPLAVLRRIAASRPTRAPGERCDMCTAPVAEEHPHVVDLESRSLLCTCRPCALLFTTPGAATSTGGGCPGGRPLAAALMHAVSPENSIA